MSGGSCQLPKEFAEDAETEIIVRFEAPGISTIGAAKKLAELPRKNASLNALLSAAKQAESDGRFTEVIESYEAAVELQPESSTMLNSYAWFLVTVKDEKHRDAERAVELARRAVRLTDERAGHILDTLAEALYQTGKLAEAVKYAEAAAKLDRSAEVRERAERFRKELDGKPSTGKR